LKPFFQILFLFLTWFTSLRATPVFTKVVLPSYDSDSYRNSFSKTENVKEESVIKIGEQNFARSGIEEQNFNEFSGYNLGGAFLNLTAIRSNGNYGYLEGTIGNLTKNGEMIRSGAADDITEVFDAVPVNSQQVIGGEGAWMRTTDSEFKMLNRLANELNAVKGQNYPLITGELKIISERPYCPSCQGVIQQFHEMFPNVKLILVDGAN
jgi:hypothetical protein